MRVGDMRDCRIIMGSPLRRYEAREKGMQRGSHRILLPTAIVDGSIDPTLVEERPFASEPSGDCFTMRYDVALELAAPFAAAFVPASLEGLFVTSSICVLRFSGDPIGTHDPGYVAGYLCLESVSELLRSAASGLAMPTLNKAQVAAIDIPELPLEVQRRAAAVALAAARAFAARRVLDAIERQAVSAAYAEALGEAR